MVGVVEWLERLVLWCGWCGCRDIFLCGDKRFVVGGEFEVGFCLIN